MSVENRAKLNLNTRRNDIQPVLQNSRLDSKIASCNFDRIVNQDRTHGYDRGHRDMRPKKTTEVEKNILRVLNLRGFDIILAHFYWFVSTSSKSENHKKSTADVKKYTIPLVSLSIITISGYSNTQALGKELYLVKINASQGRIFKGSGQCTVPSKALGSGP